MGQYWVFYLVFAVVGVLLLLAKAGEGSAERSPHQSVPVNHALHIILAIFTAGLWLIPYFIIAARNAPKNR